jgi:hypothetical protein
MFKPSALKRGILKQSLAKHFYVDKPQHVQPED